MNMLIYLGIFLFKIIEDALTTLRLIVVSNGRKFLGAILQIIATIIWVILSGTVLINFMNDLWKIFAFSIGAFFGSYLGSIIEEKIALGTNSFIVKIKEGNVPALILSLKSNHLNYLVINNGLIIITAPRKKTSEVIDIVNKADKDSIIISEKIKIFSQI